MFGKIDSELGQKRDTFVFEQTLHDGWMTKCPSSGQFPAGVDDSVSGQIKLFWHPRQNPTNLAAPTAHAGKSGESTIGNHATSWYPCQHKPDALRCR